MGHVGSHGHVSLWRPGGHVVSHGHVVWRTKFVTDAYMVIWMIDA